MQQLFKLIIIYKRGRGQFHRVKLDTLSQLFKYLTFTFVILYYMYIGIKTLLKKLTFH